MKLPTKCADIFVVWRAFFIYEFISVISIDRMTDII